MLDIILGAIALGLLWAVMALGVYITYRGLCTGLLHTKLKIPALLSGILTMIALYSINLRVMGKSNIPLLRVKNVYSPLQELGLSGSIPSLIVGVIFVVAVAVIIYWFFGTEYQSFADVQMGTGSIVIGLASLIIGEVLFGTRTFKRTLVSVSLGAIIYRIIIALVLKAGMDANDLKLFTAVTVAICLSMPMIKPAVAGFFHPGSKKAEGGN